MTGNMGLRLGRQTVTKTTQVPDEASHWHLWAVMYVLFLFITVFLLTITEFFLLVSS
jgi:hypothetical protein